MAADRFRLPPLAFAVDAARLEQWLMEAAPGDELVYAHGFDLPAAAASVCMVRELAQQGQVHLKRMRSKDDKRVWLFAVEKAGRMTGRTATTAMIDDPEEDARAQMMRILCRAASGRQPCPTNRELADEMGLKDAEAARYIFNRLRAAGQISVVAGSPRERRVVTVAASGQSTRRARL